MEMGKVCCVVYVLLSQDEVIKKQPVSVAHSLQNRNPFRQNEQKHCGYTEYTQLTFPHILHVYVLKHSYLF